MAAAGVVIDRVKKYQFSFFVFFGSFLGNLKILSRKIFSKKVVTMVGKISEIRVAYQNIYFFTN